MTMLVRLKPLSERKGHKVQVYMYKGFRFNVERGWYEVDDDAFAEELRDLRQDHYDPDSADLFDVCTEDEARRLEEKERRVAENERATVSQPEKIRGAKARIPREVAPTGGDFTSADLKQQVEAIEAQNEAQLNPPDDDDEDEDSDVGRIAEVGRVTERTTKGPKVRTKR